MKMYYTFGSAKQYPYGREDYVLVEAETPKQCHSLFRVAFPDVYEDTLNCADYYPEGEWEEVSRKWGYADKEPAVHLVAFDLMNETQREKHYQELRHERLIQDASDWVDSFILRYENPANRRDANKLAILNNIDMDDLDWLAERYADKHDASIADDAQWENFIEDYLNACVGA